MSTVQDPEPLAAAKASGGHVARRSLRAAAGARRSTGQAARRRARAALAVRRPGRDAVGRRPGAVSARVRPWVSRELLYLLAGATVATATAALVLPALAAVACALVTLASLVIAVFARRLMFEERSRRRAAQAAELRERERALRAEDALDVVALGLAGDPDSRSALLRHKVLWQAIRSLEQRVARTYEEHRRLYLTTPPRPDQPIAPPDVGALRRRRVERHAELAAVAKEIEAVAVAAQPASEAPDRRSQTPPETRRTPRRAA